MYRLAAVIWWVRLVLVRWEALMKESTTPVEATPASPITVVPPLHQTSFPEL